MTGTRQPAAAPLHRAGGLGHVHRAAHLAHRARLSIPQSLLRQATRTGPLESPWLVAGLAALLVTSVVLAVLRHRRRAGSPGRRRWTGRAGLAAWLTALTTLTSLAGLNAYVGYIPTLPALLGQVPTTGGHSGSQVVRVVIGAPTLDVRPASAYVYLPPGYDDPANATRRYPVVYLLHGYPGGPLDWFRAVPTQQIMDTMLADHLVQPMLVVAPNANGGWLHDSEMLNQVGGPRMETYLTRTVVGYIDAHFRTVPGRPGRAVGGMSSGGYGALNLGLRDQDVYSVILSEMPYGDPGQAALGLLGGSRALWAANSPRLYIPTMAFHHRVAVDLLTGPYDSQRREAARLARMLRARGQPTAYTLVPGAGHTWRSAGQELPYALRFASQHLHGRQPRQPLLAKIPLSAKQPSAAHPKPVAALNAAQP